MNYNTTVTGGDNPSGTSYDDGAKTFNSLATALQSSDGTVEPSLIAEYGMGYNNAQGSYLTYTPNDLPDAISGTWFFRIPSNQPVNIVFPGVITTYTNPVEKLLSSVLPKDGVNYLVFK